MGQFILSGSQNFHLMNSITQSLAGRVALFRLMPFDITELKSFHIQTKGWQELAFKGFYPAIYQRDLEPQSYYANYLNSYIERDIRSLTNVHDLNLFSKFIKIIAASSAQLSNLSNISKKCGISQPTAKSWISLLETTYIIFSLPPYFDNLNKRIVKSSKLYFYDTGLLNYLLGIKSKDEIITNSMRGVLFENLVVAEHFKQNYHLNKLKDYYFWRDSNNYEVDLLNYENDQFNISEIKSTQTISQKLFKGLNYFENAAKPKITNKSLIYSGDENQTRNNIEIKSWKKLSD